MSAPKLSILIPTWNNLEMLQLCIASIARHTHHDYEVVIHVNQGLDGTLKWVRERGYTHTWTAENVGICRALNSSAARARGEYLVYLNDDMYVLPGWDVPLIERAEQGADREPVYVSGTMIQRYSIAPSVLVADYGDVPNTFTEEALLEDWRMGKFARDDWNGATWPPCCIHRKWWDKVEGYSEDLSPGFYSDIDFSVKLWHAGCRRFLGAGKSLVYHFGEKSTSLVRGRHKANVKLARRVFLRKWGVLPSTFTRYYLRVHEACCQLLPEPQLRWERLRVGVVAKFDRFMPARAA